MIFQIINFASWPKQPSSCRNEYLQISSADDMFELFKTFWEDWKHKILVKSAANYWFKLFSSCFSCGCCYYGLHHMNVSCEHIHEDSGFCIKDPALSVLHFQRGMYLTNFLIIKFWPFIKTRLTLSHLKGSGKMWKIVAGDKGKMWESWKSRVVVAQWLEHWWLKPVAWPWVRIPGDN